MFDCVIEARLGVGKHVIAVDSGNFVKIVKVRGFSQGKSGTHDPQ